jgi:hypothetical protein
MHRFRKLSQFLLTSKNRYIRDVEEGKGKEWVVVMGNEAGGKTINK